MILQINSLTKTPYSMLMLLEKTKSGEHRIVTRKVYKPLDNLLFGYNRPFKKGMRLRLKKDYIAEDPSSLIGFATPNNHTVTVAGYILERDGIFCTTCGYLCTDDYYEEYSWYKHQGIKLII